MVGGQVGILETVTVDDLKKEGEQVYRIIIVSAKEKNGLRYADRIVRFCMNRNVFPQVEYYQDQEKFFERVEEITPTSVLIALSGVQGLNAVEHMRMFCPQCGIIWCSDLDFSLHAFRLRVEYFFKEPIEDEMFEEGLTVWYERRRGSGI